MGYRKGNIFLSTIDDDKSALRTWAKNASLEKWREDPIGRINGVGIVTFQYLRMMWGVDTVMPDKIVKKSDKRNFKEGGSKPVNNDLEFVKKTEEVASVCRYRPIELCWMTWLVRPEGKRLECKNTQTFFQRFKSIYQPNRIKTPKTCFFREI